MRQRCLRGKHFEELEDDEARKIVVERILEAAPMNVGAMFLIWKDCHVTTDLPICFEGDVLYKWDVSTVLYLQSMEEVVGEDAQRIIKSAQSLPSDIDVSKAKVLKLTFKKGWLHIVSERTETYVLYRGDMHTFYEYCLEPNLSSEDIVAYALWTPDRVIPIDTKKLESVI